MANNEQLRIYIQYDILFSSDLRYVLGGIEQAYNRVDSFLCSLRRRPAAHRLQVTSVHTGSSIDILLLGEGLVGVYFLYLKARELYWSGQQHKWDAKLAEQEFRRRETLEVQERVIVAIEKRDPTVMKALTSIQKVNERIERSRHIISVEIRLVDQDDARYDRPRRKIILEDE